MTKRIGGFTLSLLALASTGALASGGRLIFDFSDPAALDPWIVVNDTVMGGVSASRIAATDEGVATFSGTLSLENNGGFASVRTRPSRLDLSTFDGIRLRVRGDGRTYLLNLRQDGNFDGISYRASFETEPGEWGVVDTPFDRFVPTFRGRRVPGAGPLDPGRLQSFGFMLADKNPGTFALQIKTIEAYGAEGGDGSGDGAP